MGKLKGKRALKTAIGLSCAAVGFCCGMGIVYRKEYATLFSIKKVHDYPLYTMKSTWDYGLDKLLSQGGASSEEELVQFIIKHGLKGFPLPVHYELPDLGGCSALNALSPNGAKLFGHNHDNKDTPAMFVHTTPKAGYRSVSMVNLSFLSFSDKSIFTEINALASPYFPIDGMNEKGLAAGIMQLEAEPTVQNTGKININTTMAVRIILDKAATVNEAIALFKQYDMHASANGCFHFQVADETGDSAVISYYHNELVVTRSKTPYQSCTNYYLYDVDFEYEKVGIDRNEKMQEVLEKNKGILSAEGMKDLLALVKQVDDPSSGINYQTQWTAVYDQTNLKTFVYPGRDYTKAFEFKI